MRVRVLYNILLYIIIFIIFKKNVCAMSCSGSLKKIKKNLKKLLQLFCCYGMLCTEGDDDMKKRYSVHQGLVDDGGTGQYASPRYFDSLEAAIECFREIKEDERGWTIYPQQKLETFIVDEEASSDECFEVIDYFELKKQED